MAGASGLTNVPAVHVSYSAVVSTMLDLTLRNLTSGVVRCSVHYYNTEEEIEEL